MKLVFPEGTAIDVLNLCNGSNTIHFLDSGTKTKVHLFSSDTIQPNSNTTLADLTAVEATFPGYSPLFINWGLPQRNPEFGITSEQSGLNWRPSNDTFGGQTINGIFIVGTGADSVTLYASGLLDNPKPLLDTHSALDVTLIFAAPPAGRVNTD